MSKTFSDEAENCKINCKPTSTAMFDNEDSSLTFEQDYSSVEEAQQALEQLTQKARDIENEPCEIRSEITKTENRAHLTSHFTFSCQAEAVLFQFALR